VLPWWRRNAKTAVVALVVALACTATVYVIQEMRLREQRIAANEREARIRAVFTAPDVTLKTAPLQHGGTVAMLSSQRRDAAVVVLTIGKPAGVQRAYQVWLLEGSNSKQIGLLEPNQASATVLINGLDGATTLGVTIERAEGAPSPTLPLLAEIAFPR